MRFWSLVFAVVALLSTVATLYPVVDPEWNLPNEFWSLDSNRLEHAGESVARFGREVDHLFMIILGLTGVTFLGVIVIFCISLWKYGDAPGRRAVFTHGSRKLEIIWTLVPSLVLVFIAVYQLGTWARIKFRTHAPDVAPICEITARQFQWIARYPGDDGRLYSEDDLYTVNDFHFYTEEGLTNAEGEAVGVETKILLRSTDVLHSFFLPSLRIKQDAVPGLTIPVWFDCRQPGRYELVCAELCGWGHYKMKGKVTVHRNKAEFDQWLAELKKEQNNDGAPTVATAAVSGGNAQ